MSIVKKFKYFPLWGFEDAEKYIEDMEKNGLRLISIKYSHWFIFKESEPKEMSYFMSYKSFRGASMGFCDYFLESEHKAHEIYTKNCYYSMYRTKETKEQLVDLYEVRLDYLKCLMLEYFFTALFGTAVALFGLLFDIFSEAEQSLFDTILLISFFVLFCSFALYYFYGYLVERKKLKQAEKKRK